MNHFADTSHEVDSEEEDLLLNGHIYCETPLGLAYVYTYATTKIPDVDFYILDAQAILFENRAKGMEYNWAILLDKVRDINPAIIGVGSYYFKAAPLFHEACQRIKEMLPSVIIVTGGNYGTDATELVLDDPNVDYVILSEGEVVFTEFVETYLKDGDFSKLDGIAFRDEAGKKRINKKTIYLDDLSDMPIPGRSQLPMHLYGQGRNALDRILVNYKALGMTISRGCPYVCTFCTATNFWNRRIRYRNTSDVLDEMQILKEEYGATVIIIDDDNFLIHKERVSEILQGMIDRKLNLKWIAGGGSNVRILNKDDTFLDLVIRSGYCFFNLAIESSNNETLKRIKKPVRVEETVSLIQKIRQRYPQLYVNGYFMIGFPFETKQQIINTLEFSHELELDWCSHYIFKPFPNTELYNYCIEHGLIEDADLSYGENFKESPIDGVDWTSRWAFEKNYEYNLRVNFLDNRNLKYGNYTQALRDFEYIMGLAPEHALAYRQATYAANKLGDVEKAVHYSRREQEIMAKENEFWNWYNKLSIAF